MTAFGWEAEEHRCAADAYGPWSEYDGFDHDECEDGNQHTIIYWSSADQPSRAWAAPSEEERQALMADQECDDYTCSICN